MHILDTDGVLQKKKGGSLTAALQRVHLAPYPDSKYPYLLCDFPGRYSSFFYCFPCIIFVNGLPDTLFFSVAILTTVSVDGLAIHLLKHRHH